MFQAIVIHATHAGTNRVRNSAPEGKQLHRVGENYNRHQTMFKIAKGACRECPLKPQCAPGPADRMISRRWDAGVVEEMQDRLRSRRGRRLLKRRSTISERINADAKEKHGMDRRPYVHTNRDVYVLLYRHESRPSLSFSRRIQTIWRYESGTGDKEKEHGGGRLKSSPHRAWGANCGRGPWNQRRTASSGRSGSREPVESFAGG